MIRRESSHDIFLACVGSGETMPLRYRCQTSIYSQVSQTLYSRTQAPFHAHYRYDWHWSSGVMRLHEQSLPRSTCEILRPSLYEVVSGSTADSDALRTRRVWCGSARIVSDRACLALSALKHTDHTLITLSISTAILDHIDLTTLGTS